MSVHEDLLNNGENNCSFTEDEVDIMCSKDGDDACGDGLFAVEETLSLSGLAGSFDRLAELHMSQIELSRRTGIATSTISDWRKKKINPQADKLVAICKALDAIWFFL